MNWKERVHHDLTKAVQAAERSFNTPGVIVGFQDRDGEKTDYLVRLNDGNIGLYSKKTLGGKELHTGIKIRGNLPEPKKLVGDPDITTFIFEVLREQIKLIPRIWLRIQINRVLEKQSIEIPDVFQDWVLLPKDKKKDKTLMKLLELALEYEGLRGLARYNDYSNN